MRWWVVRETRWKWLMDRHVASLLAMTRKKRLLLGDCAGVATDGTGLEVRTELRPHQAHGFGEDLHVTARVVAAGVWD
jgi:hypothetical protein